MTKIKAKNRKRAPAVAVQRVVGRTERTSWHVEWNGLDREPCMVTSDVSAEDAKNQAATFFDIYSRVTTYRLVEVVERRTVVERFKASSSNVKVSDGDEPSCASEKHK